MPSLTLNYGLRWDRIAPWTEKYNQISTFVPGAQSVVFPGAPAGILYPGDPGVSRTLAPVSNLDFSPRVGLAWSPTADSDTRPGQGSGIGGYDEHSRRLWQLLYLDRSADDRHPGGERALWDDLQQPCATAVCDAFCDGIEWAELWPAFPYTFAPLNSSRNNPDYDFNWATFEPVSGIPGFSIHNKIPYTEEWMLSDRSGRLGLTRC